MIYDTLGFTIHRRCNAACDICCFSSSPESTEKLNVSRIKQYIDEAAMIDDITTIAFTGGEPFLEYNLLIELIEYTKKAGKKANTITNGFWASTYEKTIERLERFHKIGLDFLSISHDNYHKKYVSTQNIKNILRATAQLGIPTSLTLVKVKDEDVCNIINDIGEDIYTTAIKIAPCLPAGKAHSCFSNNAFDRTIQTKYSKCTYGGNLTVDYNGRIYPCCAQTVLETGLEIGNFNDISLHEALKKVKNNALLYFLRNANMSFYAEYASKELGFNIPEYVVSPCELCSILFQKDNMHLFTDYVRENINHLKQGKAVK